MSFQVFISCHLADQSRQTGTFFFEYVPPEYTCIRAIIIQPDTVAPSLAAGDYRRGQYHASPVVDISGRTHESDTCTLTAALLQKPVLTLGQPVIYPTAPAVVPVSLERRPAASVHVHQHVSKRIAGTMVVGIALIGGKSLK